SPRRARSRRSSPGELGAGAGRGARTTGDPRRGPVRPRRARRRAAGARNAADAGDAAAARGSRPRDRALRQPHRGERVRERAGRGVATDNDAVALEAARQGAALNGMSGIDWALTADPDEVPGRFPIVIANILLNTLEELAPAIARKVADRGRLVLSGLLFAQGDDAERAYAAQG